MRVFVVEEVVEYEGTVSVVVMATMARVERYMEEQGLERQPCNDDGRLIFARNKGSGSGFEITEQEVME